MLTQKVLKGKARLGRNYWNTGLVDWTAGEGRRQIISTAKPNAWLITSTYNSLLNLMWMSMEMPINHSIFSEYSAHLQIIKVTLSLVVEKLFFRGLKEGPVFLAIHYILVTKAKIALQKC